MPGARDQEGDPQLAHEFAEQLGDGVRFSFVILPLSVILLWFLLGTSNHFLVPRSLRPDCHRLANELELTLVNMAAKLHHKMHHGLPITL